MSKENMAYLAYQNMAREDKDKSIQARADLFMKMVETKCFESGQSQYDRMEAVAAEFPHLYEAYRLNK